MYWLILFHKTQGGRAGTQTQGVCSQPVPPHSVTLLSFDLQIRHNPTQMGVAVFNTRVTYKIFCALLNKDRLLRGVEIWGNVGFPYQREKLNIINFHIRLDVEVLVECKHQIYIHTEGLILCVSLYHVYNFWCFCFECAFLYILVIVTLRLHIQFDVTFSSILHNHFPSHYIVFITIVLKIK